MIKFIETTYQTIASAQFLLLAIFVSLSVKTYFLSILIPQGLRSTKIQKPWWYLLGILFGSMFGDVAWVIKLIREIWCPQTAYGIITFFIRLAWGFLILQYQSLALFIESLTEKNFKLRPIHKIVLFIGSSFSLYFFYLAFFDSSLTNEFEREKAKELATSLPLEIAMMRYVVYYLFNLLLFPSLYITLKKLRTANLPHILKKQLRIFIQFLILPYVIIEFLQAAHFLFKSVEAYLYPIVSISTILLIYGIYYCLKKIMGLRFLNFASHVQAQYKAHFIDDFKNVLDQLSYTTSIQELNHIIQTFFKDAFSIPPRKCMVYIRNFENKQDADYKAAEPHKIETIVEHFTQTHDTATCAYINKHKVLIYDEIAFSNFYDEDAVKKNIITFLETINADIFLPVYEKQKIVAYIIVERYARLSEFYSNVEHDEMIVFASYLGNILNLLKNRTFETLAQQEKELRDELYSNYQEMNQYKESIRSFLRNTRQQEIGIIFYKNRRFIFGNQTAKEIVKVNLNTQEGHPLTQVFKSVARQVEEYKTPQTLLTKDTNGTKLMVCGMSNLEHNNVIITTYYPGIADIITKQIISLKDPSKWDYLLYLETTQAGTMINTVIPGSGEILLHFKINLLKLALAKKPILFDCPEEDITLFADLIHRISGRETLQTLSVNTKEKHDEIAQKLFGSIGINQSLFKKLDTTGTLLIQHIDNLSWETQEQLADYIHTGYYKPYKSDQKNTSALRLVIYCPNNIQMLVQEGIVAKSLYTSLHKTQLAFPSLALLPEYELFELIDGFIEQSFKTHVFKNILELTAKEKSKLLFKRPTSLHELKQKVHQALIQKSKKNHLYDQTQFEPASTLTDPELIEASRLGKHALRDVKIMSMLWHKFKNQNQIATFLGVNRSSVNRRCKDYNLG